MRHVDVLVDGRGRDGVGGLEQPRVDDFETGVAQDAGDDLDAAIVTVKSDFCDEDAV